MLTHLPRSGGWLKSVKVVLGLVELGAALKFVSNADLVLGWGIFTRQMVLVSWTLLCGEIESFLPPRAEDTPAGALAMAERGEEREGLNWYLNDLDGAPAAAREGGNRVFIDFTSYTCTNCRWMESNMFTIPEVEEQLERFMLARLYTDGEGEVYEDQMAYQKEQFGTIALAAVRGPRRRG